MADDRAPTQATATSNRAHARAPRRGRPPALNTHCALFLDIDGTLLDLASTPDRVRVDTHITELLPELAEQLCGAVALITGRALADADRLFPGLAAARGRSARPRAPGRRRIDSPARSVDARTRAAAPRARPVRDAPSGPAARGQGGDARAALPARAEPRRACPSDAAHDAAHAPRSARNGGCNRARGFSRSSRTGATRGRRSSSTWRSRRSPDACRCSSATT